MKRVMLGMIVAGALALGAGYAAGVDAAAGTVKTTLSALPDAASANDVATAP